MLHLETVFAPNLIWNGGFFKLQETPEVRKLTEKARGRQKWGSPGFSTGSWLGHCRSTRNNGRVQKWGIPFMAISNGENSAFYYFLPWGVFG
jgi:hypothetical protein